MPTNRRIFSQDAAAATGDADQVEGLVVHLDANDEDSIEAGGANQGNGSGTWFDIANHDLNVPLIDKGTDLVLHLNASDTTSYGGSGTTWTDLSSDGNNGTIDGATFGSDTRGYFTFDGTNDEVEVGADTDLSNNANNFSAEVWFNADSVSGTEYIFYQNNGTAGADHQFIIWRSSSNVFIYVYGSSVTTLESLGGFTQGEWSHIAFTFDGSNVKGYVNGTLKQTTARTDNANTSTDGEIYLGSNGTTNFFTGKIAVARYYKTALTDSEIAQNFRADCLLSFDSIYSTNLQMHLDAGDETTVSASTWSDKANSNDGAMQSGFSTLASFYDKELGNWIEFDGSDDIIEVTGNSNLYLTSNTGFSLEAWVSRDTNTPSSEIYIIAAKDSSNYQFVLGINSSGHWIGAIQGNGYASGSHNPIVSSIVSNGIGNWDHVVLTQSATDRKNRLYVNGVLIGTQNIVMSGFHPSYPNINIGAYVNDSGKWDGRIGVVRLYKSELTTTQVAQNYLATKNNYPNGFNGTISGADFDTNSSSPNEKYFDFSGASSDLITIPDNDLFDMEANSSMEIWLTKSSGTEHIINKKGGGIESWSLWTNGTKIYFYAYNSGGSGATTALETSSTLNSTWNHIIVTVDDALDYEIYLNGSSEATDTSLSNRLINSDTVKIGSYSGSFAYAGKVAMLKFHAKELSSSEVTANYNATKATFGL